MYFSKRKYKDSLLNKKIKINSGFKCVFGDKFRVFSVKEPFIIDICVNENQA